MSQKEKFALHEALVSASMEGFEITAQTEQDCIRLMSGEVSVSQIVAEILARPAAEAR